MPSVTLGSVVGTTFRNRCVLPVRYPAACGSQSTGSRSMRFIMKIHTNIVSAIGATMRFLWWKISLTVPSTNSITISTKFCSPLGAPALPAAVRATRLNRNVNSRPMMIAQPMLSRWIARNPIASICSLQCAKAHASWLSTWLPSQ